LIFMPKKQNTNGESTHETANMEEEHEPKMPIFTCSCGEEILIIPDIKAMNEALKNHVSNHNKATNQTISEQTLVEEMLKQLANNYFQLNPR
jgi:hypothetical protein